jgi:phosphatidylserine/phosphatidylglycerophosphate/cardiolipin synthase-like enzyme
MSMQFFTRPEYYDDLITRIDAAGQHDQIDLASMSFDPRKESVANLMEHLNAAARRGVDVRLMIDSYTFLGYAGLLPGPLFFYPRLTRVLWWPFRGFYKALQELEHSGGVVVLSNLPSRPFTNPLGGRSHIKFACVNDYAYTGGCNLDSDDSLDVMIGWKDKVTAEYLRGLITDVATKQTISQVLRGKDVVRELESKTDLLVDAGVAGQSKILDTSLKLIDEAEREILLTCQYFPNSVTAEHLLAAHQRGVKVRIIYNLARKHRFPYSIGHWIVERRLRRRLPQEFFADRLPAYRDYLHAKILVSEKASMIGSHNYIKPGVDLGTAEIAVLSTAPGFITATRSIVDKQLL